ncbi:hypothetical protein ACH50O_08340 [Methylomonas sp. 2BW1-5-20]|uniref:hypothetical protein n=1 Tax=Methylomonas sp. 2BW1-5-20 TaxID=3376686 RepID=UPI00404D8FFD
MSCIIQYLDVLSKLAIVLIAVINFVFAVFVFFKKNHIDRLEKESDRKINWLKSLILDHNLDHFYEFFDRLDAELAKLKVPGIDETAKQEINDSVSEVFIYFRRNLIDMFLAVDIELYNFFIASSDSLQDHITESIFDAGINLSHTAKFDEVLNNKVMETKTNLIKRLFEYRGHV